MITTRNWEGDSTHPLSPLWTKAGWKAPLLCRGVSPYKSLSTLSPSRHITFLTLLPGPGWGKDGAGDEVVRGTNYATRKGCSPDPSIYWRAVYIFKSHWAHLENSANSTHLLEPLPGGNVGKKAWLNCEACACQNHDFPSTGTWRFHKAIETMWLFCLTLVLFFAFFFFFCFQRGQLLQFTWESELSEWKLVEDWDRHPEYGWKNVDLNLPSTRWQAIMDRECVWFLSGTSVSLTRLGSSLGSRTPYWIRLNQLELISLLLTD